MNGSWAAAKVIGSVLGKYRRIEQDQARNGFTRLGLSVETAMETVSHPLDWRWKDLGKSVQAKRK